MVHCRLPLALVPYRPGPVPDPLGTDPAGQARVASGSGWTGRAGGRPGGCQRQGREPGAAGSDRRPRRRIFWPKLGRKAPWPVVIGARPWPLRKVIKLQDSRHVLPRRSIRRGWQLRLAPHTPPAERPVLVDAQPGAGLIAERQADIRIGNGATARMSSCW